MGKDTERIYYSRNIVNLCIDTYDAEKQCGRLWSQYAGEPVLFTSLYEALECMEALYDALRYPYASTQMRSFREERGADAEAYGFAGSVERTGEKDVPRSVRRTGEKGAPGSVKQTGEKGAAGSVERAGEKGAFGEMGIRMTEAFDDMIAHRGQGATFIIRVQYRQHSSWQGEVVWVDGGKKRYFESVLELVRLIDRALEGADGAAPVSGE